MRAISLVAAVCLLGAGAEAQVAEGVAAFNRGDYKSARSYLNNAGNDARARVYLAMTDAATGQCGAAVPALETGFAAKNDANLRKLAGLALAQCHIATKQFAEAE